MMAAKASYANILVTPCATMSKTISERARGAGLSSDCLGIIKASAFSLRARSASI
jgi:hypothetical protein